MQLETSILRRFIACPACGARLSVDAARPAGTLIRCGACAGLFRAPAPAIAAVPPAPRALSGSDSVRDSLSGRGSR